MCDLLENWKTFKNNVLNTNTFLLSNDMFSKIRTWNEKNRESCNSMLCLFDKINNLNCCSIFQQNYDEFTFLCF